MSDNVNSPSHYTSGSVECIEAIEACVENPVDYYRGTCLKYIWRSGRKVDDIEDLKKCQWYLTRWVRHLEGAEAVERDLLDSVAAAKAALREVSR